VAVKVVAVAIVCLAAISGSGRYAPQCIENNAGALFPVKPSCTPRSFAAQRIPQFVVCQQRANGICDARHIQWIDKQERSEVITGAPQAMASASGSPTP
jgi:hypothetical protein